MSAVYAGIDGGGTRTRVMLMDVLGNVIGTAEGGPSAIKPGKADVSADVMGATVREALVAAGHADTVPTALCVGVAGAGREPERSHLERFLHERGVASRVFVMTDGAVALEDAFGDSPGVIVISGTGSFALGRGPTGAMARCGGWGPNCGDEGSGFWIGRRALSVVTASQDGREPETALTGAVLTAAGVQDVPDLIPWAAEGGPGQLATLATAVMATAQAGDLRANSIVTLAVEELVLHARTLARQLFVDERAAMPLAFGGSLLSRGSLLRKRLVHRLKSAVPGAVIRDEDVVAVRGAVRAAMRLSTRPAA